MMTAVWRAAWAWIYKCWRWFFTRFAAHHVVHQQYRGPRLRPVSCLAYPAHNGAHALRKPDWVRDAVFALASASASDTSAFGHTGLGCCSIAQLFNLYHRDCGVSVSKSFAYGLLKTGRMRWCWHDCALVTVLQLALVRFCALGGWI